MSFTPEAGENVQLSCTVDNKTATIIKQICDRSGLKRPIVVAQMIKYAAENYSPQDPTPKVRLDPNADEGRIDPGEPHDQERLAATG